MVLPQFIVSLEHFTHKLSFLLLTELLHLERIDIVYQVQPLIYAFQRLENGGA
jgi:hypothetical protein